MPNPDGTMTKDEIKADILARVEKHVASGMDLTAALDLASMQFHADLADRWDEKVADVEAFLAGKAFQS